MTTRNAEYLDTSTFALFEQTMWCNVLHVKYYYLRGRMGQKIAFIPSIIFSPSTVSLSHGLRYARYATLISASWLWNLAQFTEHYSKVWLDLAAIPAAM